MSAVQVQASLVLMNAQPKAMEAQLLLRPLPDEPDWRFGLRQRRAYIDTLVQALADADLLTTEQDHTA